MNNNLNWVPFELHELVGFVVVAENMSMTIAAEKLRIAQPALSRKVHNLENELGVRLFNRVHSRMELTPEGHWYFLQARYIVRLCRNIGAASDRMKGIRTNGSARVRAETSAAGKQ